MRRGEWTWSGIIIRDLGTHEGVPRTLLIHGNVGGTAAVRPGVLAELKSATLSELLTEFRVGPGKVSHLSKSTVLHLFYQCSSCISPAFTIPCLSQCFILFYNSPVSPTIPILSHDSQPLPSCLFSLTNVHFIWCSLPSLSATTLHTLPHFPASPTVAIFSYNFWFCLTVLRFHFLSQFYILSQLFYSTIPISSLNSLLFLNLPFSHISLFPPFLHSLP